MLIVRLLYITLAFLVVVPKASATNFFHASETPTFEVFAKIAIAAPPPPREVAPKKKRKKR